MSFSMVGFAQNEPLPAISCYELVNREYSYNTEMLMHDYEMAKISPKDFEEMRSQIIHQKSQNMADCEHKEMATVEATVESIKATTVIYGASGSRFPASVDIHSSVGSRGPASLSLPTPSAYEGYDFSDENIPEYNGERVSIDN